MGPVLVADASVMAPSPALAAELERKDTETINIITAGEAQKSSFAQCAEAADAVLCRILVGAVNAAAIIGSSVPSQ
jgi:hypothetical protein